MTLVIKTTGVEDYLGGESNIKALIMGAPGAGKTPWASFWPKPIFADCEKGRMSIAYRKVPYAEITSQGDMDALLTRLKLECKKPLNDRLYRTLVIDTLDSFQRIVIKERLDKENKESFSGWGDWGYLDAKMTQFIARLHELPMNIVVNLHVRETKVGGDDDGEGGILVTGPKLKGDLREQIAAEFDLVGFMGTYWEAEGGERVLKRGIQWHPDPTHPILKDRSHTLPKWTSVSFSDDDYTSLFIPMTEGLDSLKQSEVVETLQTDTAITAPPAPPQKGGPVAGAPIAPAPDARKAAKAAPAKKAAAPAKATEAKPEEPTEGAAEPAKTPTPVAVPAAPKPTVPAAPKPEVPGADAAPVAEEPVAEPAAAEPAAEVPSEPAEAPAEEPMSTEALADALDAEVTSEAPPTDEAPTGEAETAAPAEVETVAEQDAGPTVAAKCGTSSNEGEEGQPGSVPGCGADVDVDLDMTQIAMFKTRTFLCPACYQAWRATNKK